MIRKNILIILPLLMLLPFAFFTSCEEEKVEPDEKDTLNQAFYDLMEEWYYWYEEIPEINPDNYDKSSTSENLRDILNDIRYEKDTYSYITSYEAFRQYVEKGSYTGYGFGSKWDEQDTLRLTFVFNDSPLKEEGIERGWALTKIDGNKVTPENFDQLLGGGEHDFTFVSPSSQDTIKEKFARKEISMNTVLKDTIIEYEGKDIGYLVLKSFINKTPDELTGVFRKFADENIEELVVDLRYNGGGTLSASRFLGEFIINDDDVGEKTKTYVEISHNDKKAEENDTTHVFGEDSLNISLGLDRTYFLTTQATASASEALINGLKPHMDNGVHIIGEATYGKPVGMYAFTDDNKEYAFLPVCFALKNDAGDADYYDGLQPDASMNDDFKQPFGSLDDDLLLQALNHIVGRESATKKALYKPIPANEVEYRSLRDEIGAF
ncbi:MAG: S41 family peptidase [Bacteroidales bacterium]